MAHYNFQKTLLVAPLLLGVAACGGGGGGTTPEEDPTGPLASFAEREAFAEEVIAQQQQIVAEGAADPTDLNEFPISSASYDGAWAMSLDPDGETEIVGGSVALEADFASGALTGTMEQQILAGADGTLTVENGTVSGAQLAGDLQGSLDDPDGGSIDVDTNVDGFVSDTGAQGTMDGTATRGGDTISAQGVFASELAGGNSGGFN